MFAGRRPTNCPALSRRGGVPRGCRSDPHSRLDPEPHTFLSYPKLIRMPMEPTVGAMVSQWIGSRLHRAFSTLV